MIRDPSPRPPATIVIPLLDQVDAWLEQSVRSALDQTVRCEVIVVRSPRTRRSNLDLLAQLGREHDGLAVIAEPPGGGFAAAINAGIRSARAERVGLLLSDDWLELDAVERCLTHSTDIVSTAQRECRGDGTTLVEIDLSRRMEVFRALATLEEKARYLQHFFLFRTATLLAIGGADESLGDFPGIDDFDMIWTLLERGASVAIVEASLYNYRDHDGERLTLRDREQGIATLRRILAKHGLAGAELARVLALHAPWVGRPVHVVHAELAARRASRP